jgi:hypothetical protein
MNDDAINFELTPEQIHNPVWVKIRAHLESRLSKLRELNDSLNHTVEKTIEIRAEIKAIKKLLAAGVQRQD